LDVLSAAGVSAMIAVSEIAFVALMVVGAVVLLWVGIQSLRRSRRDAQPLAMLAAYGVAASPSATG